MTPSKKLPVLIAIAAQSLSAATPSGSEKSSATEDPLVLSPFVVSTDRDTGYLATTTLAGTRLRSELGDIGTSISVVTQEFLRDTGATNTEGLLTYMAGTEVGGLAGNMSQAAPAGNRYGETGNLSSPQTTTRVRGLAAATQSRNFYVTSISLDSYNVDRVEINRGANSVLFGTGSPAGIINSSLKQAVFRTFGEVEARWDNNDAKRASFDFNQLILPGELALRINGLNKRAKFEQEFSFSNDKRIYGAITYDPKWARTKNRMLSGTVLRANLEHGDLESRSPRTLPPINQITPWFQPWLNLFGAKMAFNPSTMQVVSSQGAAGVGVRNIENLFRNPSVWFDNPASSTAGTGSSINGVPIVGRQGIISNMTNPVGTHFLIAPPDLYTAVTAANTPDASFYYSPSLTDESIFDFKNRLIEGPNRLEYSNFRALDVSLEQRFLNDHLGFELAYNQQDFTNGNTGLTPSPLAIDVNTHYLDGSVNPNFGRPFFVGTWNSANSQRENESRRATAFYKLDFAKIANPRLAPWLGSHTFTLLAQEDSSSVRTVSGPRFSANNYTYGNNAFITDGNGTLLTQMSYIGPSLADRTSAAGANLTGLTAPQLIGSASGQSFQFRSQTAGSPFLVTPLSITDNGLVPYNSATGASWGGIDSQAQAAVLQSKFLHGLVVATYGWRRDEVDAFTAAAPSRRAADNHLILDPDSWWLPTTPSSSVADETVTKSLVVHTPRRFLRHLPLISRFSLRYNTSENFAPGAARFDSNGQVLSAPSGETEDIGFAIGLANDRIILNAVWYETAQRGVNASAISTLTNSIVNAWRLVNNMAGLGLNPRLSEIAPPPDYLLQAYGFSITNGSAAYTNRNDIVLTQDFVSKGVEFEAQVNMTKNWRMFLSAARQDAVRSNTGAVFRELFFERNFNGQTLAENWTSEAAASIATDESGGRLHTYTRNSLINPFNNQALQDGGPAQELRKWRASVVSTYAFPVHTFLKGFSIGSGVRWQDKVAIGFPIISAPSGARISDVAHPYYGPEEYTVDSWLRYQRPIFGKRVTLNVQLNVFNVWNDDALIPVATQPDGSISTYRIPASRRYELTTRFSF